MKFTRYNSLTNHYNQKFIDKVIEQGLSTGLFVGTEKAHGANFSFYYDGAFLRTAKRSGFNEADEHFYGSQELISKYGDGVRAMWDEYEEFEILVIRGEVIGGNYAGKKATHATKVQAGVEYCPNNEFVAFDIEVNGKTVDYQTFKTLCDYFEIPTCPEIVAGTLEECLTAPNEFDSLIPGLFGLENLKGNTAEGIVIRPVDGERYLHNGTRVIIKSKNDKFSENKSTKVKVKGSALSKDDKAWGESLTAYFSKNRISNVLSKEPEITSWKEFPRLAGLLFQDALQDFETDRGINLKEHLDDNWKSFVRVYKAISDKKLREHFKKVID